MTNSTQKSTPQQLTYLLGVYVIAMLMFVVMVIPMMEYGLLWFFSMIGNSVLVVWIYENSNISLKYLRIYIVFLHDTKRGKLKIENNIKYKELYSLFKYKEKHREDTFLDFSKMIQNGGLKYKIEGTNGLKFDNEFIWSWESSCDLKLCLWSFRFFVE